jgi:hypothetical protein
MKIIGNTKDGVIAQLTNSELANLIGYYSEYNIKVPPVGSEVQVGEMFQQLYAIKNLKSHIKEIERSSAALLECIRTKNPVIEPISDAAASKIK